MLYAWGGEWVRSTFHAPEQRAAGAAEAFAEVLCGVVGNHGSSPWHGFNLPEVVWLLSSRLPLMGLCGVQADRDGRSVPCLEEHNHGM